MPRFNAADAQCLVFTFKKGMLSPMAHDLKLRAASFSVDVKDDLSAVTVAVEADSVGVVCAMRDGVEAHGTLSQRDKKKIKANIANDVLKSRTHPDILFESRSVEREADGYRVEGDLTLCGHTRELLVPVRAEGSAWVAEVTLHQPDFGIKPYSAMLGTLRVEAHVKVLVAVPRSRA